MGRPIIQCAARRDPPATPADLGAHYTERIAKFDPGAATRPPIPGSVADLDARPEPDAAVRIPYRPAARPIAGRSVNRFGVIDAGLASRHTKNRADRKTADKTGDETIAGGCRP